MNLLGVKAFDGDSQIIYSEDFNIYENKLVLENILGSKFILTFIKEKGTEKPSFEVSGSEGNKEINIVFTNFINAFGVATTSKIPITKTTNQQTLYFSVHAKSLAETTTFLKISVTFYLK